LHTFAGPNGGSGSSGVGVVPIPAELVAATLSEGTLALLAPQPLTLRLSLHPTGEPNYPFASQRSRCRPACPAA